MMNVAGSSDHHHCGRLIVFIPLQLAGKLVLFLFLFSNFFFVIVCVLGDWNDDSWGRGHPEDISATMGALVEDKFDSDGDKKRTTGQILWIRGLTRLQTQVGRS